MMTTTQNKYDSRTVLEPEAKMQNDTATSEDNWATSLKK